MPSELLESSASSSSFALQENTSCVQLLGNHHYQQLNMDKMNDVAAFITQVRLKFKNILEKSIYSILKVHKLTMKLYYPAPKIQIPAKYYFIEH